MFNYLKNKFMAFRDIFKKSSDFNEKTVIGFLAFAVMVFAIVVDLITGFLGRSLEINEYIFDAFMWIVLGSFLPDVLEKFAEIRNNKKNNNTEET